MQHGIEERRRWGRRWGTDKPLTSGPLLRELRDAAGISVREVCQRIGISQSQLSDIERGIQSLSLRRAKQISSVLQHSLAGVVERLLQEKLHDAGFDSLEVRIVVREPENL